MTHPIPAHLKRASWRRPKARRRQACDPLPVLTVERYRGRRSRFLPIWADVPSNSGTWCSANAQPAFDTELPGVFCANQVSFAQICGQQRTREPFSVLNDKDISGAGRGGDRVREGPLAHRTARAGGDYCGGDCEPSRRSRRRQKRFARKLGRSGARSRVERTPGYPLDMTTWRPQGIN